MACGGDRTFTFIYEHTPTPTHEALRNQCRGEIRSTNPKTKLKRSGNRDVNQLSYVDHVTTHAHSSRGESQLYTWEDNEAVSR